MNTLTEEKRKVLKEVTENNQWYACFLKAVRDGYNNKVWGSLIQDCNSDIMLFGYEYAKKRWKKFMDFHYAVEKVGMPATKQLCLFTDDQATEVDHGPA